MCIRDRLYGLSLDELIDFNVEQKEIEAIIEKTSEETQKNIDWSKVWAKKLSLIHISVRQGTSAAISDRDGGPYPGHSGA